MQEVAEDDQAPGRGALDDGIQPLERRVVDVGGYGQSRAPERVGLAEVRIGDDEVAGLRLEERALRDGLARHPVARQESNHQHRHAAHEDAPPQPRQAYVPAVFVSQYSPV